MASPYSTSMPARVAASGRYDVVLLIGRILLVVMFIYSGIGKFADLSGTAAAVAGKGLPVPMLLAALAALAEVAGGLMVALGWWTRLAALGLLVYTVAATLLFHDFWNMSDQAQQINMIHAMKNLSIAGAFLMLFASGPGAYAYDRRR